MQTRKNANLAPESFRHSAVPRRLKHRARRRRRILCLLPVILVFGVLAAALLREGADRAYFARIGETASEKIYLSWEDSVKNARAQYRSVIERWNSGELPRRRVLPGAPEWTGDVAELINRARTGWDKAREALDRYL